MQNKAEDVVFKKSGNLHLSTVSYFEEQPPAQLFKTTISALYYQPSLAL